MKSTTFLGILFGTILVVVINGEVEFCLQFGSKYVSENQGNLGEVSVLRQQIEKEIENVIQETKYFIAANTKNYTTFYLNFSHPAITLVGNFTNGTTTAEDSLIRLWTITDEGLEIFNLTVPSILMDGNYNVNGYVGAHRLFDIYGNGTFSLKMTNFSVAAITGLRINSTSLCIPLTVNVYLKDYKSNFANFMNGDVDLDPLLNGAIQSLVPDAVRIIWRETMDAIDPLIQSIIDKIIHKSTSEALSQLLYVMAKYKDQLNLMF